MPVRLVLQTVGCIFISFFAHFYRTRSFSLEPVINRFRNGSFSLCFSRVLQVEIRSSKLFSSVNVAPKHQPSFCSQFFSNSLQLFSRERLVPWRCHGYFCVSILLNSSAFSCSLSAVTRSVPHIEIYRTNALELSLGRFLKACILTASRTFLVWAWAASVLLS